LIGDAHEHPLFSRVCGGSLTNGPRSAGFAESAPFLKLKIYPVAVAAEGAVATCMAYCAPIANGTEG